MYVNEDIRKTVRVFPPQERYNYLRYDMNENPEGLPLEFVEEVKKEITPEFLSIYPEPDRFLHKYAKYVGVDFFNVVTTNGSDMAIRYLLETFGEKGKKVVTVAPSFEMYWVNCNILGYKHVPVSYNEDLSINVDNIISAIDSDTRIVVLLNPNNPVGNVYSDDEAEKIIKKAAEVDALVIVDEAYHYFYEKTFLPFVKKYNNVAVLRTFSKLFSIAACRLGIVIGSEEIIHYVKNARLTFDANAIALLFAERIIDHPEIEQQLIATEKEGRKYILDRLSNEGYECRDCKGNFIFVKPKTDPVKLADRLKSEYRILVKTFTNPLLSKYLRISTGSVEAMEKFLTPFLQCDK